MDISALPRSRGPTVDLRSSSPKTQSHPSSDTGVNHRYGNINASGNTRAFLGNVHGNVQGDIYGNVINNYQTESKEDAASIREECLSALLLCDPQESKEALKDRKGDRAEGTCSWFLESDEFKRWHYGEDRDTNVLWLFGHPGTGKSTMSIFVADSLVQEFQDRADVTFCYFFCDTNSEEQNSAVAILRGFLYQLCTVKIAFREGERADTYFLDKYILPEYRVKGSQLFVTFSSLSRIFQAILKDKHGGRKLFLLDAFDECDSDSQRLFLRHLNRTSGHFKEARLFITSRPHANLQEFLDGFPNRDIVSFEAARRDVNIFIAGKISELTLRKRYTAKLRSQVLQTLTTKAEGTFLWVGLACKELDEVDAKDCLQLLSRLPSGLDHLYADLLDRALEKAGPEAKDLIQVLKFVSVALSPITLAELSVACRLYEQEEADERELFTRNLVDACRFMVIVVENKYVRLLHKSVRDFLFRSATEHFPSLSQADADVASRCVDRLIENHENHVKLRDTNVFPDITFVEYATRHWPDHAYLAADNFKILPHQECFFTFISKSRERWLTDVLVNGQMIEGAFSIFHVVAEWGLLSVLEYIKTGNRWQVQGLRLEDYRRAFKRFGGNPLVIAAATKHVDVFKALLDLTMTEIDTQVMISSSMDEQHGEAVQTQNFQFPVTNGVIMTAAENYEAGLAIMKTLKMSRQLLPIDEDFVEFLIEHTNMSKEIFITLLHQIEEVVPSSDIEEIDNSNSRGENETIKSSPRCTRSVTRFRPGMVESIVRRFDRSIVDSILTTIDRQDTTTMGRLLEAASNSRSHGSQVMRAVLDHSKSDLPVSYSVLKTSMERFDANLVRRLIAIAGIEVDKSLLASATTNEDYGAEIVPVILQLNPQISVDDSVLGSAIYNRKHGKKIVAQLLDHVGTFALSLSAQLIRLAMQNDVFSLQFLDCAQDISMVIPVLHEWLEDALSAKSPRYYFYDDVYIHGDAIRRRGRKLLLMLIKQESHSFAITAEVLQLARKTAVPQEDLAMIFKSRPKRITYSSALFAEAASWLGKSVMQALSENCDDVPVTEDVQALIASQDRSEGVDNIPSQWACLSDNDVVLAIRSYDTEALETRLSQMVENVERSKFKDFVLTAVGSNNTVALRSLLRLQREICHPMNDHSEALFRAVTQGRIFAVKVLLEHGVSANALDGNGMSILCAVALIAPAASVDSSGGTIASDGIPERIMRLLLEAGAKVDARRGQAPTALQIAVSLGNLNVVKILLAGGADVKTRDGLHSHVLVDAASSIRDSPEIIRLLIEYGATFDSASDGLDVLYAAVRKQNDRIIHLLLSQWTWPRLEYQKLLLLSPANLKPSTMVLLLRHGVEVDVADEEGRTCLHRAVTEWSHSRDDLWFMNVLMDAGAQVNKRAHNGQTVLHWACRSFSAETMITYLLDHGAHKEELDKDGCTALHIALYVEHVEAARLLLWRGARTEVRDNYGITAMQLLRSDANFSTLFDAGIDTSDDEYRVVALVRVLQHTKLIETAKTARGSSYTSWCWGRLALWLFRVRQPEEATTALEQPLDRAVPEPKYPNTICDDCECDLRGVRHKCSVCDDYDLCDDCWTKMDGNPPLPCNADHKDRYIHAPGPSWKDRLAGIVNDRHESMEGWLKRLEDMCSKELRELEEASCKKPSEGNAQSEIETEHRSEFSITLVPKFQNASISDETKEGATAHDVSDEVVMEEL